MLKKLSKHVLTLLLAVLLFGSCSNNDDKSPVSAANELGLYYPGDVNSEFSYNGNVIDTSGGANQNINYLRKVKYVGKKSLRGVEYIIQENEYISDNISSQKDSVYFRRGEVGIYYYANLSSINDLLPDSLKNAGFSIESDNEALIFYRPPQGANNWTVFKINLKYGTFSFNILDVKAQIIGEDNLELKLNNESKNIKTLKIRYEFKVNVINPQNPLSPPTTITFEAFAWFAKNYGMVKFQGDDAIFNALYGGGVDLNQSSRILIETLSSYSIK